MATTVSIIIPVYNDVKRLRTCLGAIENQMGKSYSIEVLVVDNDSSENVAETVTGFPGLTMLREQKPGSYAARNRAIREAHGEILAFTDADCVPHSDWIESGVSYFHSHGDISLLAGRISVVAADPMRPTAAEVYEKLHAFPQEAYVNQHRFGATANLFVRKAVFDAVGPFIESVLSGGDREFGRRATAAGFALAYASDVVVEHPARSSLRSLGNKARRTLAGMRDLGAEDDRPRDSVAKVLRSFVPPVPTTFRALTDRRLSRLSDRAKYALAVLVLHYMRTWARLQLALGRPSPR